MSGSGAMIGTIPHTTAADQGQTRQGQYQVPIVFAAAVVSMMHSVVLHSVTDTGRRAQLRLLSDSALPGNHRLIPLLLIRGTGLAVEIERSAGGVKKGDSPIRPLRRLTAHSRILPRS